MHSQVQGEAAENRQGGIQVIARAAAIMRALSGQPQGLSLGAIAQQVKLPRSTVQRIVCALEAEGLVESAGPGGGFRLGPELNRLIYQTQIDIISAIRPLLEELSAGLQESIVLCAAERDQVVIIDRIVAERELRVVFPVGVLRAPIHQTAPGKALLAAMPDGQLHPLLDEILPADTAQADDRAALLAELEEIRKSGVATDYESYREGVAAFAVAVHTVFGDFAIAIVLPASRAQKPLAVFAKPLLACKQEVERKIGAVVRG